VYGGEAGGETGAGDDPPGDGALVATGATEVTRVVGAALAPGAKIPPGGLPEPAPGLPEPAPGLAGAGVYWPSFAVVAGWLGVVPEPPFDGVEGTDGVLPTGAAGTVLPPPLPLPDPQPEPAMSFVG
jgi:hypothetical protein